MQSVDERLELVRFKVDKTPHIRLNRETCVGWRDERVRLCLSRRSL